MSNVLDDEKQQQILSLGRLGWTLRRIEEATAVRRETASGYLKAAGISVRGRGRPGIGPPKPAITEEVSTDLPASAVPPNPGRSPSTSACAPFHDVIVEALGLGRNSVAIWQDLVGDHGFTARYASVRRFVLKLPASRRSKRAWSSGPGPARKARSITARAPWSVTQTQVSIGGPGSS